MKLKNIIIVVIIFLFGVGSGILIIQGYEEYLISKEAMKKEAERLITDKIAIVNLDKGVVIEDEHINYAEKLLIDINENFLFTGLEDARSGYATGIYAGYLVIPATFSESVVSLNDTPIRAQINYAINDNLEENLKETVIYDVINLVADLNNQVSYMYMYSVMDEFHDAQDKANIVMENDLEEKEAINAIEADDLVALVPVTELTEIENNIEPVDISEYMAKNVELTGEVGIKYNEYLMASQEDHAKLNEEAMALMTEMGNMDSIIGNIDLMHDADGNSIYQKGSEELQLLFENHNTSLTDKEVELQNTVLAIYGDIQTYLNEYQRAREIYQTENEERYLNTLVELEELFHQFQGNYVLVSAEQMQQLEEAVAVQNEQIAAQQIAFDELPSEIYIEEGENSEENTDITVELNLDEVPEIQTLSLPETEPVELSELQKEMQQVLADNYYVFEGYLLDEEGNVKKDEEGNSIPLTTLLNEYNKDLNDKETKIEILEEKVGEIEKMDISLVTQTVNEEILTPIQEKVDSITKAILDQYAIEKEQLGKYSDAVMDYDPLKYIDYEEIQKLTEAMYDNGTELSEAIIETDVQQMEYVTKVYEATRNDLDSLQEAILQAKEDSDLAVAEGLAELQMVKNSNSNENQSIMYDFSAKLPYTRLGSLEYRQAYEFMTNPLSYVEMDETVAEKTSKSDDSVTSEEDSVAVQENRQEDIQTVALIICSMICVIIVITTIKYHFHKKEEEFFEL